jgi:hypothetical protein
MAPSSIIPKQNQQQGKVNDCSGSYASGNSLVDLGTKSLSGWKLTLVMIGLCSAVFCMALVRSFDIYISKFIGTNIQTGQYHHCNGNPAYYGRIPCIGRSGLVSPSTSTLAPL